MSDIEKKKILVVDDEEDLREILSFNLTAANYEVDEAASAEEALQLINNAAANECNYSLMLLDVMMEGISGFELAEQLAHRPKEQHIPIIFLTAKDGEENTLHGFAAGADDYVTKPFSVREVVARVKAVINRSEQHAAKQEQTLIYRGLCISLDRIQVTVDGEPTQLTKTEFDLLRLLLGRRGEVLSRQQLLKEVWPSNVIVTERTVDVNITRLRKKLGQYAGCIVSRQGFGYIFETQNEPNNRMP